MKANTGVADRVIRLIVGILLIAGKLARVSFLAGTLGTVLAVIGAVFIVVAAVGFCPLYVLFGISTCPRRGA